MVSDHETRMEVESESQRLVRCILEKVTSLLEVIKSMESSLKSEDVTTRRFGFEILAEVIQSLPKDHLNEMEISVLLGYFNALLKADPETAKIGLSALKALFEQQRVLPSEAAVFVEGFFNEIELVDLTKQDKMCLYKMFHTLLTNSSYLTEIKRMKSAFIPGILQVIELETDPQCLMVCFSIFQIVASHFPLGVYGDEMFEFPAAYFPIDFNAPPERHGGVTRALLEEEVEKCLLSSDLFGDHVFKLCIEKISSQYPEAQLDGLQLLKRAVLRFDPTLSSEYLGAVWSLLRKLHIGHDADTRYQERILRATTVLAGRISETNDLEELERFARMVWKDFEDNEAFLEHAGWKFAVAFAGGSQRCGVVILPKCLNKITFMLSDEKMICPSLLDASTALINLLVSTSASNDDTRPAVEMLMAQACTLLLNSAFDNYYQRLIELIALALPLESIFSESQRESIKRFIENSITASKVSPASLKRFISSCNLRFGETFTGSLRDLARTHRCVWLLAGLVDKDGVNAKEICRELLGFPGPAALDAVREIILNHPNVCPVIYDRVLGEQEFLDCKENYEDLLTVIVRSSDETTNRSKLASQSTCPINSFTESIKLRIILSNCQTSCLTPEITVPLSQKLMELSNVSNEEACNCLALVSNKYQEELEIYTKIVSGQDISSVDPFCIAYIAKGLLLKGHDNCEVFINIAINNITKTSDGPKAFAVISKQEPRIFSKDGHCTVGLLHSQRLLVISMKRLLSDFDDTESTEQAAIASAICLLVQNTKSELVRRYTEKLRPVLQWCLVSDCLPSESVTGFLQCLRQNIPHLQLNVNILLPPLLRWIERPHPMPLRIEALLAVFELKRHFEIHHLLPHKKRVLKTLPLGDRKRLIRLAASQASVAWHMLGES